MSQQTIAGMKQQIADEGWCVIQAVIPADQVGGVRESIIATLAEQRLPDDREHLDKASGLITLNRSFAPYLVEPRLFGLCEALLGEHFRISYTTCFVTQPGNARGEWHADWPFNQSNAGHIPAPYPDVLMHLTTIWMLTPFTAETGTLVVPGSHRQRNNPSGRNGVPPDQPHPAEINVQGEAGSVLVMDSRAWHARSPNRSNRARVILPIRFAPWWLNLDSLRPESDERDRLTAGGLKENVVPLVPRTVFAELPQQVKPLFRHWLEPQ